jgi:hypothetical protein
MRLWLVVLADTMLLAVYLLSATAFYATKNVCGFDNPFLCYSLFLFVLTASSTANSAINLVLRFRGFEHSLIVKKLYIFAFPASLLLFIWLFFMAWS